MILATFPAGTSHNGTPRLFFLRELANAGSILAGGSKLGNSREFTIFSIYYTKHSLKVKLQREGEPNPKPRSLALCGMCGDPVHVGTISTVIRVFCSFNVHRIWEIDISTGLQGTGTNNHGNLDSSM